MDKLHSSTLSRQYLIFKHFTSKLMNQVKYILCTNEF